ncbi:MAG: hypothetical protein ACOYN3_01590 [Acidimicrobiia bacterium]
MTAMSIQFARAVHVLTAATRAAGLVPPAFCSPPRRPGAMRTIRRARSGHAVIAIRLSGRAFAAIVGDMVEGVLVANDLRGPARERLCGVLCNAMDAVGISPKFDPAVRAREVASEPEARMAERQTQAA